MAHIANMHDAKSNLSQPVRKAQQTPIPPSSQGTPLKPGFENYRWMSRAPKQ